MHHLGGAIVCEVGIKAGLFFLLGIWVWRGIRETASGLPRGEVYIVIAEGGRSENPNSPSNSRNGRTAGDYIFIIVDTDIIMVD